MVFTGDHASSVPHYCKSTVGLLNGFGVTSGGTMANLEALWIASQLKPGRKILASEQTHYSQQRISMVLGLPFESVPWMAERIWEILDRTAGGWG